MTARPDNTTADTSATIAALQQRLDAGLAREATLAEALAQRNSEFGERIEHQAATIHVLKVMSASPGDPQPVFDLIARQAANQCNVPTTAVATFDGTMMHLASQSGLGAAYAAEFPRPVGLDFSMGRAVLNRRVDQVEDITAHPGHSFVNVLGHWSVMAVPMLRHEVPLGAITIGRPAIGPFSASQVALLQTFAEQAVIAITSAETYRALQTRTADLQESLEYQTATSDVLKVISRSTFDLQPVLETLVETAARLCDADQAVIAHPEGNLWRLRANFGFPPEYEAYQRERGLYSLDPHAPNVSARAVLERRPVHIHDVAEVPGYPEIFIRLAKQRTSLGVPLLREGEAIGYIVLARQRVEPFTDRQIDLVSTFAAQAVIAIENARLITEQREALEQQTATAEVLQVINASPGDLAPIFDAMLEKAMRLCGAAFGELYTFDGENFTRVAHQGVPAAFAEFRMKSPPADAPGSMIRRLREGTNVLHIADVKDDELYRIGEPTRVSLVDLGGARTVLTVALRKDDSLLGFIVVYRQEVRPFGGRQVALLHNFADQAVIAIESARLISEQREALEQQTATAEVLQVINASPGNLTPVFEAILEKAHNLCDVAVGSLSIYLNGVVHTAAARGFSEEYQALLRRPYPAIGSHQALMRGGHSIQTPDFRTVPVSPEMASSFDHLERMNLRTGLWVPLRKDGTALGCISAYRDKVQPFSEKEIALLENFAAQAVIAMENARLLDEIRQRQEELRVTFENMGDGVAMFDQTQHLVAWNRKFQDILDLPDGIIAGRQTFSEYIRYLAERGEYDHWADPEEHVRGLIEKADQSRTYERTRPDGRVIEIRHNPVPGGGFVLIYADVTERKRNEAEIRAARDAAEEASRTIEAAYRELKTAQANLIQAEKMASLGQLTAGIAHEIKNPLNFVNNFADLSADLLDELNDAIVDRRQVEIDELTVTLKGNLAKIIEHGRRADSIVKNMLLHSRSGSSEHRLIDLNAVVEEALNLAYHGARAETSDFNITMQRQLDPAVGMVDVFPQEITRVLLNLINNGFYAAHNRVVAAYCGEFEPSLLVATRNLGDRVEIRVRDNGTGIADEVRGMIFEPFFTTKPTGEGTGLGLSISYDIVVKQHGGQLTVDSQLNEFTEFRITLPRTIAVSEGRRP